MVVDFDTTRAICIFLISIRLGTLFIMNPVFSSLSGLISVRVLFTIMLSAMLVFSQPPVTGWSNPSAAALLTAAIIEVAIGATLSFGVSAAFGAFFVAGKLLDIQTGFGLGAVFDPVTRSGAPLFATILNLVALAVFFGMDGHHALLRGMLFSLQQMPPGSHFSVLNPTAVIHQFGMMFSLGVALIAPVMFGLFVMETVLAVISRLLPQMNVFIVGVPVKIVVGLGLLATAAGTMGPAMSRVYATIFAFWEQVLPHG